MSLNLYRVLFNKKPFGNVERLFSVLQAFFITINSVETAQKLFILTAFLQFIISYASNAKYSFERVEKRSVLLSQRLLLDRDKYLNFNRHYVPLMKIEKPFLNVRFLALF